MRSTPPGFVKLSTKPVRLLDATVLGLAKPEEDQGQPEELAVTPDELLPLDDARVKEVLTLLDTYGGVIFTGPPGTSKTHYAEAIARTITSGDPKLVRFIQFHPSYQYEDFVQGFVPKEETFGFVKRPKHLMQMCKVASDNPATWVVLVIDELSRGDPGRIFGEALTYVEKSKRGRSFHLASGDELTIPGNLVFLCTMNPMDRGVDEVDAAFERRFARVPMEPDVDLLREFLEVSEMDTGLQERVVRFFRWINDSERGNPYGAVGHTFFLDASDEQDLQRVWDYQLRFLFDKAYQFDIPAGRKEVDRRWGQVFVTEPTAPEQVPAPDFVQVGDLESAEDGPEESDE